MDKINIKYVKISELIPSDYNPRKASKEDAHQLKKSIEKFGLVDPIIVNSSPSRKNIVIGGHFRLRVAKEIGLVEVPVVFTEIPNEKKEKEWELRDKNQ